MSEEGRKEGKRIYHSGRRKKGETGSTKRGRRGGKRRGEKGREERREMREDEIWREGERRG